MTRAIPSVVYKLLIVVATVIWGFSFVVMKDAINSVTPAWLIGIRFVAAGLILLVVFWRRFKQAFSKKSLLVGAVVGALLAAAYITQTVGLIYISPGKNAFLTAVYCVMVPFIWWALAKRKPTIFNILAAVVCITGVGLISMTGDDAQSGLLIGFGEIMTLVCAVFFALHIVAVSKYSEKIDVMVLTVYQFLWGGVFAIMWALLFEAPPQVETLVSADFAISLGYLVIFASVIALGFQNLAVSKIPPAQASVLLSLESVFGVVFSVLFYGEVLNAQLLAGFALVFVGILISEVLPQLRQPSTSRESLLAENETYEDVLAGER